MSSVLAIASVTAVLKSVIENGLVTSRVNTSLGGDTLVSALPPDRIMTGADERPQINLFVYQVTLNTTRMRGGRDSEAEPVEPRERFDAQRLKQRPVSPHLMLDLYYLVSVYGATDFQVEILLGYALHQLQQTAFLERDAIRTSLASLSSEIDGRVVPPPVAALSNSTLADQIEHITISPYAMSMEEMSKVWSSLQSRYRPSVAYKVSAVLIER
ncbi:MAG TPA: DUF4255 domain-containing protein [Roseiflexaceae bacterium]|nr:DUF4255 domain-containing protein [Roseiflexaceae bacterium]